jgi:hypothetical protein
MPAKEPEPTPNDLLPEMSVDELTHILDLYIDISSKLSAGFKHPDLDRIKATLNARNGFFSDYMNNDSSVLQHRCTRRLLRMRPGGDELFGVAEWMVSFHYLAVRQTEAWDIEARFINEDIKGNISRPTSKAKYRLEAVSFFENDGSEGCLEPDFLALNSRLRQFDEITETLPAWAASGYGMQVSCRNWNCDTQQIGDRNFRKHEIARLAEISSDLETLRDQLHCRSCGQDRPDLFLYGKFADE